MPITTSTNPENGRKLVNKVIKQYSEKEDAVFKKLLGATTTTDLAEYNYMQDVPFGLAPVVNEATPIPVDSFSIRDRKTMYLLKRGLGFNVSSEAMDTDQNGLMARNGMKMAKSFRQTKEIYFSNTFFNNAFTATDISPDGQPIYTSNGLASGVGHPTTDATQRFNNRGVRSGTSYVDVAFGYFGLELAMQAFMDTVDIRGLPMMVTGRKKLVVPTALAGVAARVAGATKMPQSGDNDSNWAGGMVVDVVVNPYLTSTSAWFLIDAEENPTFNLERRGMKTNQQYNGNLDVYEYRANEVYTFGLEKPQGIWGTTGA